MGWTGRLGLTYIHGGGGDSVAKLCWISETPWTIAWQATLSMGFPRQENGSRLPFPSPGDLPNPGNKPASPTDAGGFFTTESPGKLPATNTLPGRVGHVHLCWPSTEVNREWALLWPSVKPFIKSTFNNACVTYPRQLKCYSVQFSSVTHLCPTLCNPMDCGTPSLLVHHQPTEFTQSHVHWVGDAIQPSHPLAIPPPAFNLSQHQGLFKWVSSSHQVAKVLEFQLQHQSFQWIFTDFL